MSKLDGVLRRVLTKKEVAARLEAQKKSCFATYDQPSETTFVTIGRLFCMALGSLVLVPTVSDIFLPSNLHTVHATGFDEFEVHGRHSHVHRVALTEFGPLRFPSDYERGSFDDPTSARAKLKVGCRNELMVSHEPKDLKATVGNYAFSFCGHRELDGGGIDKVIRLVSCGG
jgi:hypothetical protein